MVIGAIGEFKLRLIIGLSLDRKTYTAFHDIILPTPDGTTQIDHILISPYGVFIIETKNYKGWIFGGVKQRTWTQSLYRRKHKFQNPLRQNYKHLKAVQQALELEWKSIHSVIVFVGNSKFKSIMPPNVTTMKTFIPYIKSVETLVLTQIEIDKSIKKLNKYRLGLIISSRAHTKNLKHNQEQPICPRCGEAMVLRTAKKGAKAGNQFWGCSAYPKCKVIKKKS